MDPVPSRPSTPAPGPGQNRRTAASAALRIALLYLVVGLLWIAASDWVLGLLLPPARVNEFQTFKGWFFIIVTAGLLFALVRRFGRSLEQTQQSLQGIAGEYQSLFERSPSAMVIFDPDSRQILAVNDVCLVLSDYPRDALLGRRTLDLIVEEDRPRAAAVTYMPGGVQHSGPWRVQRRDGRIIYVEAMTHEVDFNGKPARIAMLTDVSERLQAERSLAQYRTLLEHRVTERTAELSQANRELSAQVDNRHRIEEELRAASFAAQAANEAKSSFLANTSHEIRTPLTSILGYADLLADDAVAADERGRYLEIVRQNARHLLALIDDLLDLSRAEMGQVRVTFDGHSPREIAQQAIELLHPRAAEKELALHLRVAEDVPERIETDGVRLRQILLNLVNNAIKFTHRGSVTLNVYLCDSGRGAAEKSICFAVTDTGIGMNKEHFERIFDPFYQVEQGATKRFGGTGLGLAISRQLARQMAGSISVESQPDCGSTFTLALPLTPARHVTPANPAPALSPITLDGHVLLAEDNPNIRLLVDEYLTRAGARVTAVTNGQEAAQRLLESLSPAAVEGQAYDLVLLDLHMPVMDGSQAMRCIRAEGYTGPIVGLTADYAEKSVEEWRREGWDAMAAKPIDRQAFIPLLARLVVTSQKSQAAHQAR